MNLPSAEISRRENDAVVLTLTIPRTLAAFAGHFPGFPVLPGVVQVDWAIRFCAAHLDPAAATARDIQIKFRKIIVPEVPLELSLRLDRRRRWLTFAYRSADTAMSNGLVKMGS
jgi:3-hydroxymyristoyl/3-hydroxydecanoyl-(acyl carrier protein) dehydratase